MNIDEKLTISILLDYYGDLLTTSQSNMLKYKYDNDMSLAEVAELEGITRQGVRDSINRGVKLLYDYEDKLKLKYRYDKLRKQLISLKDNIESRDKLVEIDSIINSLEDK